VTLGNNVLKGLNMTIHLYVCSCYKRDMCT